MKKALCLLFTLAIIIACTAGCTADESNQNSTGPKSYTYEEAKNLFKENQQLFNDLVTVLMNDDDFWRKGTLPGKELHGAILDSPDSEHMDLFSPEDQQIIRQFFKLEPMEIVYSRAGCIEITFSHTPDATSRFTQCHFLFWDNQTYLENISKDVQTTHYVDQLAPGWIYY